MEIETVTLHEVLAAVRAGRATLVPATAGYVLLGLGRAMAGVPVRLHPARISMTTAGAIELSGPKSAQDPRKVVATMQGLLRELMALAHGTEVALRAIVERTPRDGDSLEALLGSVQRALIPINQGAATRALARLARDTARARSLGELEAAPRRNVEPEGDELPLPVELTPSSGDRLSCAESAVASPTPTFVDTEVGDDHDRRSYEDRLLAKERTREERKRKVRSEAERGGAAVAPRGNVPAKLQSSAAGSSGAKDLPREKRGPASVETLLAGFLGAQDGDQALLVAAAELGTLATLDASPATSPVAEPPGPASRADLDARAASGAYDESLSSAEDAGGTPSVPVDFELDASPSVALELSRISETPEGHAIEERMSSLAPAEFARPSRRKSRWLASAALGVAVLGATAFAAIRDPGIPARVAALASGLGGRAASASACVGKLTLRDVPHTHEVLLRLGTAPLVTPPLPTGVRLELVVTATDHLPRRLVLERDAGFADDAEGRVLELDAKLASGVMTEWPGAPAGEVGGTGAAGHVRLVGAPEGAEAWLVAAAGEGETAVLELPCANTAHVLVVNVAEPSQRKRIVVERELIDAAARAGGGELSGRP